MFYYLSFLKFSEINSAIDEMLSTGNNNASVVAAAAVSFVKQPSPSSSSSGPNKPDHRSNACTWIGIAF